MRASLESPCLGRADAARLFVSEAPLSMAMLDVEGRFVAASPPFLRETGVDLGEIVGLRVGELIAGADVGLETARAALLGGLECFRRERAAKLPDGRTRWLRAEVTFWRDDAGAVAGFLIVNHDITAEREVELARRETEDLLKAVVEHIPASLAVQDPDEDRYILLNAGARDIMGAAEHEALALKRSELLPPERIAWIAAAREKVAAGGVLVSEHKVGAGPAAGRTLRVKRLSFEDRAGRKRMLTVAEDVTDLREASLALQAALDEAEQANRAKTAFLATMSHEIRTPLNGVLGMVQAMEREPLPKTQRRRLEIVRQSGEALVAIVNDALDIAKIEAGKLELEAIDFDLAEVVEAAAGSFSALARSKGLELVVDTRAGAGVYHGDPTRVRQVLSNLISNAVKFTQAGEVRVEARARRGQLMLTVSDTGPGIEADLAARLFERFAQGDSSTTRRFGGTGLGLAICRELSELMGGSISARSTRGEGACFTVSLPLRRVGAAAPRARRRDAARKIERPLRVLAAEDNPVNQEVLKTILGQAGVTLTVVADGAAAVEAVVDGAWDLVLMDVQMPVMDGPSATRRIRELERKTGRRRMPIIALTADAMEHQKAEFLACGMDRIIAKPLQIDQLFAAINDLLREDPGDGACGAMAQG